MKYPQPAIATGLMALVLGFQAIDLRAQALPITNGLQLWLKADAGVGTNSSGQVTAWADQSGMGQVARPPAGPVKAPTVELNALNGYPVLRFVDGPRYLDIPNSPGLARLTQDVTILTLVKYDDLSGGHCCALSKTVGNLPAPFDWYNAGSDRGRTAFYLGNGAQCMGFLSVSAPPAGVFNVLGFTWKNGLAEQHLNDFENGSAHYTAPLGDGGGPLRIGSRADLVTQLQGSLAEILIYQPSLSARDRGAVIEYLRGKYALAFNLPPTVCVSAPRGGTVADGSQGLPVAIAAADPDGSVARVDLLNHGIPIAGWSQPPYTNVLNLLPGPAVLAAVATDNLGRLATSAPVSITVTGAAVYRFDASHLAHRIEPSLVKLGANRSPDGMELSLNNFYFTRHGKPWYPVMGEIHYSRYPRWRWEEALLKMKSGGIEVVATYLFGIHHQEIEGQWDWEGNRDLRHFIQLCARHGMYVWLRGGPYCHGECRNGGYPDWLLPRLAGPRETNPALLQYARDLYLQIRKQTAGLLFKEGGPVIGLQLDNECTGEPGYLRKLKQLAREAGLDVPYYSATGWGATLPLDEVVPVWGGYPDAPWAGGTQPLAPANQYTFTGTIADAAVGYELEQCRSRLDQGFWLPSGVPFATAEMGTGNQIRHPRRPLFSQGDIDAMQYIVAGKGANLLGYYMYHGGSNPLGRLTTLEDTYDYPKISYDFLAALGEFGQPRPWYHSLRVLHLFLKDFGGVLAPAFPVLPSCWPASPADTDTLRCIARVRGRSGFLFFNNYHRLAQRRDLGPLQFEVKLPGETLVVPREPVGIPKDAYGIWPLNLELGAPASGSAPTAAGAVLKYATAQPLCLLEVDGMFHYFFKASDGVEPEYLWDNQSTAVVECPGAGLVRSAGWTVVRGLKPGTDCVISVSARSGRRIRVTTLSNAQAGQCYKATIWGRERLFLSPDLVLCDGERLQMLHRGNSPAADSAGLPEAASLAVFPPVARGLSAGQAALKSVRDGGFERYHATVPRREFPIQCEALPEVDLHRRGRALAGAQWVGSSDAPDRSTARYYRREFSMAAGASVQRATLVYSAARQLRLWLNGQLVDEGGSAAMAPPVLDVTRHIRSGRSVIAVAATSPAGAGGWIASLVVEFADGRSQTIVSDATWKTSRVAPPGWLEPGFDDQAWPAAVRMAAWGGQPFNQVPGNWYEPVRRGWRIRLPEPIPDQLADVILSVGYVGDIAFLTGSRDGRLLADDFYSQPKWELGLRHFAPKILRDGLDFWLTPFKQEAQIYLPEGSRPQFSGPECAELKHLVAIPEYRIEFTQTPTPQ